MNEVVKYMQLPFVFDAAILQEELLSLSNTWIAHFNRAHYEGDWSALPLRSYGGSLTNVIPDMGDTQPFCDTEIMQSCPYMKSITEIIPGHKKAIRLLKLKPGAVIKEHIDRWLCYERGEVRIHIPITTNADVEFYLDKERMTLPEGECWYLNFDLPHSLANKGNTDRVHLVIDCIVDAQLKELFENCAPEKMKKTEARPPFSDHKSQIDTSQTAQTQIIDELYRLNTPTAIEMAKKMQEEMKEE